MINLHESMGPGRDRTRDPWNCSQTRFCCQTRNCAKRPGILVYLAFYIDVLAFIARCHNIANIWDSISCDFVVKLILILSKIQPKQTACFIIEMQNMVASVEIQ